MSKKKKIIIISAIVATIALLGIITALIVSNNSSKELSTSNIPNDKNQNTNSLTTAEKEISGITSDTTKKIEDDEKSFSELYKEYIDLPKEEQKESEVIPRKHDVPLEKLDEIKEKLEKEDNTNKTENEKEDIIPSKFNLTDKIDIKVGNQEAYGLCWDFASIKTLETYLAMHNLGNYDLSEAHVDYIESNLMFGYREVHSGGSFDFFKHYLTECGVVQENQVPYHKNGKLNNYTESEYDKFTDMEKVVEVTETVEFPSMYKNSLNRFTDTQLNDFRNTVKKHIMKNGGLYTITVGSSEKNHYTSQTAQEWANHAVTIVGWDDNYSKDNFMSIDGKKAEHDGAYIALNSWGTGFNDNGYYYISYDDIYVESNLSGIASTSMENAYKISSIKNDNIRNYIVKNFNHLFIKYQNEDYITKNALASIHSIDLSNSNITSLDGIEMFPNIFELNVSNNSITDISPITKLDSLMHIDLSGNNISDVSAFNNMKSKNCWKINLSNNKLKDVSSLNNIPLDEYVTLELDISKNPGVTGYEKINNLSNLNISECNINDVSNLSGLEKLYLLNISGNPIIKGLELLPENITDLNISNCNIASLTVLKENKQINYLNASNNNLTSLEGINNFYALFSLDVSGNKIIDWSAISLISLPEEEYEEFYAGLVISANNCNINDITIFNNLNENACLNLENNNIKDISKFNNEKIFSINLSGNTDLIGLESLKNVSSVFLNNCNISNLDEVLKLENVYDLSLENNNIVNIAELSKLKNLSALSLEGNKNLNGDFSSDNIFILNVSDCNLDNSFDFSKLPNLSFLNITKNPNLTDYTSISNIKSDNFTLSVEELDYNLIENNKNVNFYLDTSTITLNYNLEQNSNIIDLKKYSKLKKALMQSFSRNSISLDNGYLRKNGYTINIEDSSKESIEVKFENYMTDFGDAIIKIIYKPTTNKSTNKTVNISPAPSTTPETNTESTTNENVIDNSDSSNTQNTIVEDNSIKLETNNIINTNTIIDTDSSNNDLNEINTNSTTTENLVEDSTNTTTNDITNSI